MLINIKNTKQTNQQKTPEQPKANKYTKEGTWEKWMGCGLPKKECGWHVAD